VGFDIAHIPKKLLNLTSMRREIIPYNTKLKEYARELRNNSTFTEILMWNFLKKKHLLGYDFDRQRPISN